MLLWNALTEKSSYVQTDATTPNIVGPRMLGVLRPCWLQWCENCCNNSKQHATTYNSRVCNWTQYITSTNVGGCWPTMLCPFARGFKTTYSNCAHWMRRTSKCHCSVVYSKREAKRAFKFSSDVARQYFNKRAIADAPFSHDGHFGVPSKPRESRTLYFLCKHTLSNCLTRVKTLYRLLTFYT